jgi:5-carboxymethyl-2-hydroxymuconic-semialdehyde dehydrogenase
VILKPAEWPPLSASLLGREGGHHSLDFYTDSRIVHVGLEHARVPRFGTEGS